MLDHFQEKTCLACHPIDYVKNEYYELVSSFHGCDLELLPALNNFKYMKQFLTISIGRRQDQQMLADLYKYKTILCWQQ